MILDSKSNESKKVKEAMDMMFNLFKMNGVDSTIALNACINFLSFILVDYCTDEEAESAISLVRESYEYRKEKK